MTENEAIDKLNNLHYKIVHTSFCNKVYESEIEALCMAKDCLKEIQQYKELGTIEEITEQLKDYKLSLKMKELNAKHLPKLEEVTHKLELLTECEKSYNSAIDDFVNTLKSRLTDAIYQKDVESMTNLINDVARELKAGGKK